MKYYKSITLYILTLIFTISLFIYNTEASEVASAPTTPPELMAESAILMDADTGVLLVEKNAYKKEFPASITKVLTALVALNTSGTNLTERIEFSKDAVFSLPRDASNIAMDEGETLSLEDALYGLMLPSANEVANAIAEHYGGSISGFADKMNKTAADLGAKNSHFSNPSGLHQDDHYTCAYDMALIMREAIKNPMFEKFISTRRYDIPPTEKQSEIRQVINSNKMIQQGQFFYQDMVGGKTGYTDEAMHTLVSYAKRGNVRLVSVVLKTKKNEIYTDTAALMDYGFSIYSDKMLFDKNTYKNTADVVFTEAQGGGTSAESINVIAEDSVSGNFPSFVNKSTILLKSEIDELSPPVNVGDKIGILSISYKDIVLKQINLLAASAVSVPTDLKGNAIPAADKDEQTTGTADTEDGSEKETQSLSRTIATVLVTAVGIILLLGVIVVLIMRYNIAKRRRYMNRNRLRYKPKRTRTSRNEW